MLTSSQLRSFPWTNLSWLIVNEGELESLLEAFGIEKTRRGTAASLQNGVKKELRQLYECQQFARTVSVICTIGAEGILYLQSPADTSHTPSVGHIAAAPLKNALRDTTGAGDCFAGYFVAGLMRQKEGEKLEEVVLPTCLTVCLMTISC